LGIFFYHELLVSQIQKIGKKRRQHVPRIATLENVRKCWHVNADLTKRRKRKDLIKKFLEDVLQNRRINGGAIFYHKK